MFHAAGTGNWTNASRTVSAMNAAWARYQSGVIPRLLKPLMADALDKLNRAVASRDKGGSRQFALDVSKTGLDLLLQYRSRINVDFARLDLWVRQLIIDTEAGDAGGAASDLAIIETILFRLANTGDARDRNDVRSVRHHLNAMHIAVDRRSSATVLDGARQLQGILSDRMRAQED